MSKNERKYYFRAHELARILLDNPDMKVGIRKFGGDNRWPVTSVKVEKWDASCDSSYLMTSEEYGQFLLLEADEIKE